ncbi:MAG: BtpA/SgcQ family protein [Myxococcota bacterium]|nr:BtpA/SgcQ family protein [Myxococcota bacterium]
MPRNLRDRIIGVIHLGAMPGDPLYTGGGFDGVRDGAMRDLDALLAGGVDGCIIENFGSAPFAKGDATSRLPAHQVALMAMLTRELRERMGDELLLGVNCLRNDAHSAMGIAAVAGADFIRVNVHTGAYLTDQGVIEGEAYETLRYRSALGAGDVDIWADVLVKHATPLAPTDPTTATKDCLLRGLASAVIVTGTGTGEPISTALLETVREAAGGRPVVLGSGVTPERAPQLWPLADVAIVGTYFKQNGDVRAPVEQARVERLVKLLRDS